MYHKNFLLRIITFLIILIMIGCSNKPKETTIVVNSPQPIVLTSTATIAPPTFTPTPVPPTVTSTIIPSTPTITPEPIIFPVEGKWAGKGENGLTVLFSIVTDQNSFVIVRGFQTPRINWTCSGYRIGFWLPSQPDFLIYDGKFGYVWMQAEVIAPDKIEGSFNTRFDICGEVVMKWTAAPQNSTSGNQLNNIGEIQ